MLTLLIMKKLFLDCGIEFNYFNNSNNNNTNILININNTVSIMCMVLFYFLLNRNALLKICFNQIHRLLVNSSVEMYEAI